MNDIVRRIQPASKDIGFIVRRLLPAMNTCVTMARRQEDLSSRVARNSQLLRTRVEVELERQNQELLAQMNRRAKLQLHLQETVEGLSVVAISYYALGLIGYLAKAAKGLPLPGGTTLQPDVAIGVAVVPVLLAVIGVLVLLLALGVFLPLWNMGQAAMGKGGG